MRSVLKFFLLTYAVSWTFFAAGAAVSAKGGRGSAVLAPLRGPLFLLGAFGPAIVAVALTARTERRAGTLTLLRRTIHWRVGARWYIFAVSYMAVIKLTVALLCRTSTGAWPRFGTDPWYIILVAVVISTPIQAGEEIGWRGYALPRLSSNLGLARDSATRSRSRRSRRRCRCTR